MVLASLQVDEAVVGGLVEGDSAQRGGHAVRPDRRRRPLDHQPLRPGGALRRVRNLVRRDRHLALQEKVE